MAMTLSKRAIAPFYVLLGTSALAGCDLRLTTGTDAGTLTSPDRGAVSYKAPRVSGGPGIGAVPRLLTRDCLIATGEKEGLPLLAAALAPILVDAAFDTIGTLLKNAGEERAVGVYAATTVPDPHGLPPDFNRPTGGEDEADDRAEAPAIPAPSSTPILPANSRTNTGGSIPITNATPASPAPTAPEQQTNTAAKSPWKPPECIQFILGEFASKAENATLTNADFDLDPDNVTGTTKLAEQLKARQVFLKEPPVFMMELKLLGDRSAEGVYTLHPTMIHYGSSLDNRATGIKRDLIVEIGLNLSPKKIGDKDASGAILPLGKMIAGGPTFLFAKHDLRAPRMLWVPVPQGASGIKPLNIEMRVVEMRNANAVLSQIGTALAGGAGDKLAAALRQDLFPTDDEENVALTKQIEARTDYAAKLKGLQDAVANRNTALSDPLLTEDNRAFVTAIQNTRVDAARDAARLAAAKAGTTLPAGL
jgi:hypothetical protein